MNILDSVSVDIPEPGLTKKWTKQSLDFFSSIEGSASQNIQLSAGAGCGKTTNLVEAMRRASGRSLFLAFNRDIAKEIETRLNGVGRSRTLNSLGHGLVLNAFPGCELDPDKLSKLISQHLPEFLRKDHFGTIKALIGLAKNNNFPLEASEWDFEDLASVLDIPAQDLPELAIYARRIFQASIAQTDTFDFDDQVYFPIHYNLDFPSYENVLIDEDQDLSPINHAAAEALSRQGARLVGVGDPYQAIYGFRGALCDSIPLLVERFGMKTLPLTMSYRCAKDIVSEANRICPTLEALPTAPLGEVMEAESDPDLFTSWGMVLCRTNAPLFASVMRHVRANSPCQVRSNALNSLIGWIRKLRAPSIDFLLAKAKAEVDKEIAEIMAKARPNLARIKNFEDRLETVRVISQGASRPQDVIDLLLKLKASKTGPIFATIHKAKGLEAQSVYLLRPDLCPAPWVDPRSASYQQERNLLYVAITRAKTLFCYGEIR